MTNKTTLAPAFDISAIKPIDRTIEIIHPGNGQPVGIRISIVSIDDERVLKLKRSIQDRKLYLEARGKTFKAEEIAENANALRFGVMLGWEWYAPEGGTIPNFHGDVPAFSKMSVFAVLKDAPWIGDQIDNEASETKAFFTN